MLESDIAWDSMHGQAEFQYVAPTIVEQQSSREQQQQ